MDKLNRHQELVPQKQKINIFLEHPIVAQLIVYSICAVISIVSTLWMGNAILNVKIEQIQKELQKLDKIDTLSERMSAVEARVEMLSNPSSTNNGNSGSDNSVGNNSSIEFQFLSFIVPSPSTETVITDSWSEISNFEDNSGKTSPMQIQDPVAYDRETQEEYTLDQLVDQKVILYYKSNSEDVFFCGQFDDEGYYTGECVTNIYKDGNLKLITNANYSRGEILSFVKVFPTTTKAGVDVWALSDRVVEKTYSSGETWYYIRNSAYRQSFKSDSVTESDIISAKDFIEDIGATLEGYYYGNTSDGHFNDDTGNACLVKFFENGTVKTLYVGKIKDGDLEDTTGNAWMIGKKSVNQANYSYYKGPFVNGKSSEDSKYWTNSVSREWIDEYLQDMTFNCDLLWSLPD